MEALSLLFCVYFIASIRAQSVKQSETVKDELETYIRLNRIYINPRYRPRYHVSPPVGWMNDPNGFVYYKGEYHLFYQFSPYDSRKPGNMYWGHVSSTNLVEWKELPTALLPEEEQCFSGSGIVIGDDLVLIYTAHKNIENQSANETQYIASSSDGINFTKYVGNPVLVKSPNGSPDFRDPKVWKYGDHYYIVLGSKTDDNRGRVLLYRSPDMYNWEFLKVIGESNGTMGYMWECPDFFELDGKYILLMSPQGMQAQGDRYKNIYQTGYIIGNFNYDTFDFVPEVEFQEIDYGHDFYASQTTLNEGKRYLVAWFGTWEVDHPEDVDGWYGSMTLIRELSLKNNRILMKPVDISNIRDSLHTYGVFKSGEILTMSKSVDITIEGDFNVDIDFLLQGVYGGDQVNIKWLQRVRKVQVIRNGDVRQVEWYPDTNKSLRLFLDASSLELFCGDGEVVFSSRAYPNGEWKITNLGQSLIIDAYNIVSDVDDIFNSGTTFILSFSSQLLLFVVILLV